MTAAAAIVAIVLCAWWVDIIDRGTILALGLGWLAGGFVARYDVRVEEEALSKQRRLEDEYERSKRRGVEL